MVEIDLHLWHGRLEVRHAKRLWIFQRLWEQWELLPAHTAVPVFDEALAALPGTTPLLVDLKGWSPRLVDKVCEGIRKTDPGGSRRIVASARSWWLLPRLRHHPDTTTLRSVGTKWQRRLALRLPAHGHGVVIHQLLLDPVSVRRLVDRYGTVFTWNVETVERAEALVDMGVSGLIIDDLELIRVLRTRLGA